MKSLLSFVFCIALPSVLAAESAFANGAVAQFRGVFQDSSVMTITTAGGDVTTVEGGFAGNAGIVGVAANEANQQAANEAALAACNTDLDALRARVAMLDNANSEAEYVLRVQEGDFLGTFGEPTTDETTCEIVETLETDEWVVRVHVSTSDDDASTLGHEFDGYGIGDDQAAARAEAIKACPVDPDADEDMDENGESTGVITTTLCSDDTDQPRYLAVRQTAAITPSTGRTGGSASSDDDSNTAAYILGGAAAIAIAAYFLSGGDWDLFSATPDFGYSITESGYAYNYGGRVDFRKERWHLYWTAGQNNADGETSDFRYVSGGEYKADLWSAAFSERVQGETADYDLSLSAKYDGGVWTLSPAYRLHSRFEREQNGWQSETENSLSLEGALRANRWTVRSAAGFQWREAEDFGDNAQLKISAVRNL